jgi:hypothetical protein
MRLHVIGLFHLFRGNAGTVLQQIFETIKAAHTGKNIVKIAVARPG